MREQEIKVYKGILSCADCKFVNECEDAKEDYGVCCYFRESEKDHENKRRT